MVHGREVAVVLCRFYLRTRGEVWLRGSERVELMTIEVGRSINLVLKCQVELLFSYNYFCVV